MKFKFIVSFLVIVMYLLSKDTLAQTTEVGKSEVKAKENKAEDHFQRAQPLIINEVKVVTQFNLDSLKNRKANHGSFRRNAVSVEGSLSDFVRTGVKTDSLDIIYKVLLRGKNEKSITPKRLLLPDSTLVIRGN